jgi:hypothetical protein
MYKVCIERFEYNHIPCYELIINGEHAFIFGDKRIAEFINMSLKEYQSYLRSNFDFLEFYEDTLVQYKDYAERAQKWLEEKLEPINVMYKLQNNL